MNKFIAGALSFIVAAVITAAVTIYAGGVRNEIDATIFGGLFVGVFAGGLLYGRLTRKS